MNGRDQSQRTLARKLREGRVVPFLGAGANLLGRPSGQRFERGRYLPSGQELADYLAQRFDYPSRDSLELIRVTQWVSIFLGDGDLYEQLRDVFVADYPPTALHHFLAELPEILRKAGDPHYQLIFTTNYDDALERAFELHDEPFDLLTYITTPGIEDGQFLHTPPNGEPRLIDTPNEYNELQPDERTIIVKIHGAVDRRDPDRDSVVITEDDYLRFLRRNDLNSFLPPKLIAKLKTSNFLFLGYSLRDWNIRVLLHSFWSAQKRGFNSWAIQRDPDPIDQRYWSLRKVEILDMRIEDYLVGLREALTAQLDKTPQP